MTTKLDKPLRRELMIGREPWVITLTPTLLKLTRKGRRKGLELDWKELIRGDAALAVALNASARGPDKRSADEPSPDKPSPGKPSPGKPRRARAR